MRPTLGLLLLGLVLVLSPVAPARADDECRGGISRQQAIEIARTAGLVRVDEVDCDDDEWQVEGWDSNDREIEVEIDLRTGRIKEVERD